MRFSENFIQEVVDRTDIEELIGRYVELKRSGSNLLGRCPFHSEKTPSFSVSPTKKMFFPQAQRQSPLHRGGGDTHEAD